VTSVFGYVVLVGVFDFVRASAWAALEAASISAMASSRMSSSADGSQRD